MYLFKKSFQNFLLFSLPKKNFLLFYYFLLFIFPFFPLWASDIFFSFLTFPLFSYLSPVRVTDPRMLTEEKRKKKKSKHRRELNRLLLVVCPKKLGSDILPIKPHNHLAYAQNNLVHMFFSSSPTTIEPLVQTYHQSHISRKKGLAGNYYYNYANNLVAIILHTITF